MTRTLDATGSAALVPVTILLIDDSTSVREVLRVALESEAADDGEGVGPIASTGKP